MGPDIRKNYSKYIYEQVFEKILMEFTTIEKIINDRLTLAIKK